MKLTSILILLFALPLAHANLNWRQPDSKPAPIKLASVPIAMNRRPLPLRIPIDGSVWRGTKLLTPTGGPPKALRSELSDIARSMSRAELLPAWGGLIFPDETLVIRADENAPFDTVATILGQCMMPEVRILKVEFEVAQDESEQEGAVDYEVPIEVLAKRLGRPLETEMGSVDVELRVSVAGSKRRPGDLTQAWDGKPDTRFAYDPEEREIQYTFEELKTSDFQKAIAHCWRIGSRDGDFRLRISVASGVTVGEVLRFWERAEQEIFVALAASEE